MLDVIDYYIFYTKKLLNNIVDIKIGSYFVYNFSISVKLKSFKIHILYFS